MASRLSGALFYDDEITSNITLQSTQFYGAAAAFFINHKRETHTTQATAIITAASSFQMDPSKGGQSRIDLQKRGAT